MEVARATNVRRRSNFARLWSLGTLYAGIGHFWRRILLGIDVQGLSLWPNCCPFRVVNVKLAGGGDRVPPV